MALPDESPASGSIATSAPSPPPRVSVVLVSYRRHAEIVHCLADLVAQRSAAPFEVVLVLQDYPLDIADQLATKFAGRLSLRMHVFGDGLGVHRARNVGVADAMGDIIAFLDDDVRVPPHWIDTLARYYDDSSVGGVGGYVRHPGSGRLVSRVLRPVLGLSARRYRIDWGGFHLMPWSSHPTHDQDADWLSGCNMSFRRAALDTVGGFDEGFGPYGFDDVDMGLRVRRAGWRLLSSSRLEVMHYPSAVNRQALADFVRDEEAQRVRFVRRAIGHRRGWRTRYLLRFSYHLVALGLQGAAQGSPGVVRGAIEGARRGLALHG